MEKLQKEAIQVTKEIVIKFIESQRVSPANFPEIFPAIFTVVRRTIAEGMEPEAETTAPAKSGHGKSR